MTLSPKNRAVSFPLVKHFPICSVLALLLYLGTAEKAQAQKKMYWSNSSFGTIERANLDGSSRVIILSGLTTPHDIALDLVRGKIYWSEWSSSRIRRANLDGSGIETIATPGTPEGIAVDAAAGKVYWTRLDNTVQRANLDGTSVETTTVRGRGIDLDLVNGKMYVCGGGGPFAGSGARRANLDGSSIQELIGANSEVQMWIAVNPVTGKVLYESTGNGNIRIGRMNLDGSSQEYSFIVDQFGVLDGYPSGMDFNERTGEIYWKQGDFSQSRIRRAAGDSSGRVNLLYYSMVRGGLELDARNTPPTASNLSLTPAFPRTEQNLVASYAYADVDGEAQSGSEIRWYRNGSLQSAWNNLTTVSNSATSDGDAWFFTVRPSDGIDFGATNTSTAVVISNRPPVASSLAITPAFPKASQNLTASYTYQDANGDAQSGSQLRWFRNGTNVAVYNNTNTIPSAATALGEQWHFTVQPSDGSIFGNSVTSAVVTVQNLAPSASNLFISPENPLLNQSLTANYTYSDPNGDAPNGTEIRWFRNGVSAPYDDQTTLPANATSANDAWYFTVRPSDGSLFGSVAQSATVQVQPDCFTSASSVSFESLGSFTSTNLQTGGVTVTAQSSPGVGGTINVLNLNGLGVVGGIFGNTVDATEALRFQFDAGAVTDVSYYVSSAGNQNGNGTVGEAFVTGFDANGHSLGAVAVNGSGTINASALFANQPLSAIEVRANQDNHRIGGIAYLAAATVGFTQTEFLASEAGAPGELPITLIRSGNLACLSAVLVTITGGTAQAGADYVGTNFPMSVIFPPGATNATIPITLLQDTLAETNETITFSLSTVVNCTIGSSSATLNLTNSPMPPVLTSLVRLGNGTIQFTFTNQSGASFSVLAATNLALPLSNWSLLGPVTETPPGQYQFTDPEATNHPQRFYRVRSP